MALRETIQAGVATAFAAVDNMKTAITIYRQTSGSYDSATGVVSRATDPHAVNAVLTTPSRMDLKDPRVRVTDTMALVDAGDIGVEPQIGMRVDRAGQEYTIKAVQPVGPATAGPAVLWKLAIRRPSAEAA